MSSIDVCVCTFRRASLGETLRSLAAQDIAQTEVRVIVADNDEHPGRREEILALSGNLKLHLQYVHAPSHNISIARNACLDAGNADWLAFIDDDEIAATTWLGELLRASDNRDVIFGVSQAVYGDDAPQWIRNGDYHSARFRTGDPHWNGYTGNVLLRRSFLKRTGMRFELERGQTGGEDTVFFFEAMRAGARFGYAPTAIVMEPTALPRTTLKWLLLRRYRAGQIHYSVLQRQGRAASGSALAIFKCGLSMAAGVVSIGRPARAAAHLLRGALHLGVVAGAIGMPTYREYRGKADRTTLASPRDK